MNGQKLLNNTLRINAVFSMFSGIDIILFDRSLMSILSGKDLGSLAPMGIMLIGFAVFVFFVSMLRKVNKYLVGAIILMDSFWVLGSILLVITNLTTLTAIGVFLILSVALVIGLFAFLQGIGLLKHLKTQIAS